MNASAWRNAAASRISAVTNLGITSCGGNVCASFKGMTDAMLACLTRRLQELKTAEDGYTVYVRPELVVEDIQASPQYPGGLALRFARVKGYRRDKSRRCGYYRHGARDLCRPQGSAEGAGFPT